MSLRPSVSRAVCCRDIDEGAQAQAREPPPPAGCDTQHMHYTQVRPQAQLHAGDGRPWGHGLEATSSCPPPRSSGGSLPSPHPARTNACVLHVSTLHT